MVGWGVVLLLCRYLGWGRLVQLRGWSFRWWFGNGYPLLEVAAAIRGGGRPAHGRWCCIGVCKVVLVIFMYRGQRLRYGAPWDFWFRLDRYFRA